MNPKRRSWTTGARVMAVGAMVGSLIVAAPSVASAAETSFQVTVSDPAVTIGDTVTIAVAADDADDLYAYSLALGYDPELLTYVGGSAETAISGVTHEDVAAGEVEVTHTKLGTSPATSGDVTLITATFEAIADGTATVTAGDLTTVTAAAVSTSVPTVGSAATVIGKKAGPVPTTVPSIKGTARVGYVLTVDPGEWEPADVDFAYQWLSGGIPIAGAEATTFRARPVDVGRKLTAVITATRAGYESRTVAVTSPTIAKAITKTSLTGSPARLKSGRTMTATVKVTAPGTIPTGTLTFRYRGKTVRSGITLVGGKATVRFRPTVKGSHRLYVTYVPSAAFTSSRDSILVRVV